MKISTYEAYYVIILITFLQVLSPYLHIQFTFVRNDHYIPKIWGYNSGTHMEKYK